MVISHDSLGNGDMCVLVYNFLVRFWVELTICLERVKFREGLWFCYGQANDFGASQATAITIANSV